MSKMIALLALFNMPGSKDVKPQPDFKMLHSKMNVITCGLISNINNQKEYLKTNKKDIEELLVQTQSIKLNSSPSKRGIKIRKRRPSFMQLRGEIINYRDILTTAMEAQNGLPSEG